MEEAPEQEHERWARNTHTELVMWWAVWSVSATEAEVCENAKVLLTQRHTVEYENVAYFVFLAFLSWPAQS